MGWKLYLKLGKPQTAFHTPVWFEVGWERAGKGAFRWPAESSRKKLRQRARVAPASRLPFPRGDRGGSAVPLCGSRAGGGTEGSRGERPQPVRPPGPAPGPPPASAVSARPPGPASAGGRAAAAAARVAAAGWRCCRPQPAPCSACRTRSSSKLASSPCSSPGAAAAVSTALLLEPRPRAGSVGFCVLPRGAEPSRDGSFGGPVPGRGVPVVRPARGTGYGVPGLT